MTKWNCIIPVKPSVGESEWLHRGLGRSEGSFHPHVLHYHGSFHSPSPCYKTCWPPSRGPSSKELIPFSHPGLWRQHQHWTGHKSWPCRTPQTHGLLLTNSASWKLCQQGTVSENPNLGATWGSKHISNQPIVTSAPFALSTLAPLVPSFLVTRSVHSQEYSAVISCQNDWFVRDLTAHHSSTATTSFSTWAWTGETAATYSEQVLFWKSLIKGPCLKGVL